MKPSYAFLIDYSGNPFPSVYYMPTPRAQSFPHCRRISFETALGYWNTNSATFSITAKKEIKAELTRLDSLIQREKQTA